MRPTPSQPDEMHPVWCNALQFFGDGGTVETELLTDVGGAMPSLVECVNLVACGKRDSVVAHIALLDRGQRTLGSRCALAT